MIFFRPTEGSSLNIFYSADGKTVTMQTASADLPGPVFSPHYRYPAARTTYEYSAPVCEHAYETRMQQLRHGDEAESLIKTCTKCGDVKVLL